MCVPYRADRMAVDSSTCSNDSWKEESLLQPIVVGYAFGPKKMSTMKKVMADASKSISDTVIQFVPLDLDFPLQQQQQQQQHEDTTSFDVILHKMTEDILLVSSGLSSSQKRVVAIGHDDGCSDDEREMTKAQRRIQQLVTYKETVPSCILIDHPKYVETLLCRSDTSHILSECLVNVTTTTRRIPVRTPNFIIVHEKSQLVNHTTTLPYPLIAKPLAAAGTVQSHKMVIIRRRDGFDKITIPCLLQEYVNHNEQLFKVYVLGDNVWVFARHSLPDLPQGEDTHNMDHDDSFLEFDSQKTYPSLSDFHIHSNNGSIDYDTRMRLSENTSCSKGSSIIRNNDNNQSSNGPFVIPDELKPDEIRPIVEALRKAFSIDLFGFDLLMSTELSQKNNNETENNRCKELLVVDVNYFPSFKEVPNFPLVLAKYLLQRGMEARNNQHQVILK